VNSNSASLSLDWVTVFSADEASMIGVDWMGEVSLVPQQWDNRRFLS